MKPRSRILILTSAEIGSLFAACGIDLDEVVALDLPTSGSWERVSDPRLGPRTEADIIDLGSGDVLVFRASTFTCPLNADCATPETPPLSTLRSEHQLVSVRIRRR